MVNTAAPAQTLTISQPATDGQTLYLSPGSPYPIQACFSASLDSTNPTPFSVSVNNILQPRTNSNGSSLYAIGGTACGFGLNTLTYNWTTEPGTNNVTVTFTNSSLTLTATRQVVVVNPAFSITSVSGGPSGESIVWQSNSNLNYEVLATTNLDVPFTNISGVIPGSGGASFFFDPSPDPFSKFYEVIIVP